MALFWSLFTGGSFLVDFLENEIVGFDENLTVALIIDRFVLHLTLNLTLIWTNDIINGLYAP